MEGNPFDLEYQYQLYLERVALKEEEMHPVQKAETKRAFFGGCGQILVSLIEEVSALEDNQADDVIADMMNQCASFWEKQL